MAKTTKKESASGASKKTTATKSTKPAKSGATKRASTKKSEGKKAATNKSEPAKGKGTKVSSTKASSQKKTASSSATKPTKRTVAKEAAAARGRKAAARGPTVVSAPVEPAVEPSASQIAERAYHLFLERGCQHGRDLEDWLEAERQLTGTHG